MCIIIIIHNTCMFQCTDLQCNNDKLYIAIVIIVRLEIVHIYVILNYITIYNALRIFCIHDPVTVC